MSEEIKESPTAEIRLGIRIALTKCINFLNKQDKIHFGLILIAQIGLSVLDLVGVAIIGLIGALSVAGVQSQIPGSRIEGFLNLLKLGNLDFQHQVALLAIASLLILIARTLISIYLTKKMARFLSKKAAQVSLIMAKYIYSGDILRMQSKTLNENLFMLSTGVNSIFVGIIGYAAMAVADISLLLILFGALFFVDPKTAICAFATFAVAGYSIYSILHSRARTLGELSARHELESGRTISNLTKGFREVRVRSAQGGYFEAFSRSRLELSDILAELSFMPNLSKYVIEIAVMLCAFLVSAVQFLATDAKNAIATLAIFMAASARIAPAAMRIQQNLLFVRTNLGVSEGTILLVSKAKEALTWNSDKHELGLQNHEKFVSTICVNDVSVTYPNKNSPALQNFSVKIQPGERIGIVGPSGSGKTTLVDLVLGILNPDKGSVQISNLPAKDALERWPGAVSYVPQEVMILQGSLRENVMLDVEISKKSDEKIIEILTLVNFPMKGEELNLDSYLGEGGIRLSGGQRQRLGIARALYTNPKILVLDEATSSLDAGNELVITDIINHLKETTILTIAHRLSTVKNYDKILYLRESKLVGSGTFDELRSSIPEFNKNAKLLGM